MESLVGIEVIGWLYESCFQGLEASSLTIDGILRRPSKTMGREDLHEFPSIKTPT